MSCKKGFSVTNTRHQTKSGSEVTVLKETTDLQAGEVIDSSRMNCKALCDFYEEQLTEAKEQNLMVSLHLKATMMKVSDPIMFGHCVKVYYKDLSLIHISEPTRPY